MLDIAYLRSWKQLNGNVVIWLGLLEARARKTRNILLVFRGIARIFAARCCTSAAYAIMRCLSVHPSVCHFRELYLELKFYF